jgi:hypothetical protein
VAKGLSRLIHEARRKGLLKGLKIIDSKFNSHFVFVDDVILFRVGNVK